VNDPKFNKPGKFPAMVELQWKRPDRIAEVITPRFLSPGPCRLSVGGFDTVPA